MEKFAKPIDKVYSTYYWKIFWSPNSPDQIEREFKNLPIKNILIGYSKFQGDPEPLHRIDCLMSKIKFLMENYLNDALKIEIYTKKPGNLARFGADPLVITLYDNDILIPAQNVTKLPENLRLFLDEIYRCRRTGETYKKPEREIDWSKDEIFNINAYSFTKCIDVLNWCNKQIANGFPRPVVEQFYRKYESKLISK